MRHLAEAENSLKDSGWRNLWISHAFLRDLGSEGLSRAYFLGVTVTEGGIQW